MSASRVANTVKSALGAGKTKLGSAIGNESMAASGKVQQAEAQAANTAARAGQTIKGVAHNVKGAGQRTVGAATGNKSMEAEGHLNSARGDAERKI